MKCTRSDFLKISGGAVLGGAILTTLAQASGSVTVGIVTVDQDKCKPNTCGGNGWCIGNESPCPIKVFEYDSNGKAYPAKGEECISCMICVSECPEEAITIEED